MKSSSNRIILFALISLYILKMSNAANNISIKFPFCIKGDQPPDKSSCQSPEFSLYQNEDDNKLRFSLELANAGNFTVDDIIYSSREILLSDPNDCLPSKLISLDFDAITPFVPVVGKKDFRVYNCSRIGQHGQYDEIGCLSGGSSFTVVSVVVETVNGITNGSESNCKFLKNVSVPTTSDGYNELSRYSSIKLTWDEEDCESCESMNSTSDSPDNDSSSSKASRVKWLFIVGAIAISVITFRVCWIWWLPHHSWRNTFAAFTATTNDIPPFIHQTHEVSGLNQTIVNSYPTVVIGKSGREIKSHDDSCPICLGEYVPGDTLKIIPECIHRFHVECIDLWLTSNATCPVCRISPSHHNFTVS